MTDTYESYGAVSGSGSGAALIAAANAKKMPASKKPRKAQVPPPSASAPKLPSAKAAKPRRGKRAVVQASADGVLQLPITAPGAGWVTRGVDVAFHQAGRLRLWSLGAAACYVGLVILAVQAWRAAPHAWRPSDLVIEDAHGREVPATLVSRLYRDFPDKARLNQPDAQTLVAFRDHLAKQRSVESVEQLRIERVVRSGQAPRQVLRAQIVLRTPLLPVRLSDGRRVSVDAHGVLLPDTLEAPRTHPVLVDLDRLEAEPARAALQEVLAFWPLLSNELAPERMSAIYLQADLQRPGQRGIVIELRDGTRILWGRPGDGRYGIGAQRKVTNLVHALACQGPGGGVIDARFHEPVYPLASAGG